MEVKKFSKTVYNAYDAERNAKTPVKKTVAPIPVYFAVSEGHFLRISVSAPEQNQKKEMTFRM